MRYESSGFWPVPINDGNEYALLLKAPTHLIKAAYRSCPISLTVATATTPKGIVASTVLVLGDDLTSPFAIAGVHRHPEELMALNRILHAGEALFVFFDELSRPVVRATCKFEPVARAKATSFISACENAYTGPWISMLGDVLTEVEGLIDPAMRTVATFSPAFVTVPMTLSGFQTNRIVAVGEREVREFRLEDPNEGYVLEHGTWHLLKHLFAGKIFHSPQVAEATKTRELTDIFGFCKVGMCFVEAKAMAVLSTDPERSTERRAKNIQKQIDKGLGQLPAAMRNVAKGFPLTSKSGEPICIQKDIGPFRHGIVMVSELLPAVDWKTVTAQLLAASSGDVTMFHVLDLQELRLLVGVSKKDPVLFLAYLLYRFEQVRERGSALVRMKLSGPPLP
jgi:hypothetical protein